MTPSTPSSPTSLRGNAAGVLSTLADLRATDSPTHGGEILSYVYDSGIAELDALVANAAELVRPVNGLDPTVFGSVAALERDLIAFTRTVFGDPTAVGSVTSGGTESCILAVKAARDHAGVHPGTGSIVLPSTAHAAFDKAARLLGATPIRVPVDPSKSQVTAAAMAAALRDDTFLIVASAPDYPTGGLDPIGELGALALMHDLPLHVDACLGGFVLPWWPEPLPEWDLRVPGVTSLSADFHKYGYAPKGASIILHTDRDRHRAGYFATTDWPGYPIVNPTLLGSRTASGLAAAWAITQYLGHEGFRDLVADIYRATGPLRAVVEEIDGLRLVGSPIGPVFAVAADLESASPVDPHRWAGAVAEAGFTLQAQPRFTQTDGTDLPSSTHLTVTPVTAAVVDRLVETMRTAADAVRGMPAADPPAALADLAGALNDGVLSVDDALAIGSEATEQVLIGAGIDPRVAPGDASDSLDMAAVVAAIETLPRPVTAKMLTEFLAAFTNPG
ncbi:pyridoxal phosphate-dependent decarboxylase family protein [Gordonia sp. (in: high G+C Gram-positive bacteria)]|uniref:pyridoxal phosphate-dependent decarboxylase family protein n=1 Tax=Gordonia sp. (in: high G+C Gram-positive bacteria) TaxID=84139 RepID=UPI003C71764A